MNKIILIGIIGLLFFISGCNKEIPNPDMHDCLDITCCKGGYNPSLFKSFECQDESYNWDEEGICPLGYFGGCKEWKEKNIEMELFIQCSSKLSQCDMDRYMDNANWECTEYANKTTINQEWFDNCCINIKANIGGGEKEEYDMAINKTSFTMGIFNQQNNTLYSGGKICFDNNDDFESINIGNQAVDMAKCSMTPKMIDANETICVAKRLRGY